MVQRARRPSERLAWPVELLAALGLFAAVVIVLELTFSAAWEAVEGFGLLLSTGFGCLGQPGVVC